MSTCEKVTLGKREMPKRVFAFFGVLFWIKKENITLGYVELGTTSSQFLNVQTVSMQMYILQYRFRSDLNSDDVYTRCD